MRSALRRITAVGATFVLASMIGVMLQSPARATAGPALDIEPSERISNTLVSSGVIVPRGSVAFTAQISDSSTQPLLILAKFEAGPNDPDQGAWPPQYGSPDGGCTIAPGETFCDLNLQMNTVSTNSDPIRFWINGRRIDLAKPVQDETGGCIDSGSDGTGEATDFVLVRAIGLPVGGAPQKSGPIAGALANPPTCPYDGSVRYANDAPGTPPDANGSPTPTITITATSASPSPSDTSSWSPSPVPSISSSPSALPTTHTNQSCGSSITPWVLTDMCDITNGGSYSQGGFGYMSVHVVTVTGSATAPLTAAVHVEAVNSDTGDVLAQCSNTNASGLPLASVRCNSSSVFTPPIPVAAIHCVVFGVITGSYSCDVSP